MWNMAAAPYGIAESRVTFVVDAPCGKSGTGEGWGAVSWRWWGTSSPEGAGDRPGMCLFYSQLCSEAAATPDVRLQQPSNGDALQRQALRLTGPSMVLMIRGVKYCTQSRG